MRDEKDDKVNVDETSRNIKTLSPATTPKNVGVAGPDEKIKMRRKIVVETPRKQFPRQRRQKMLALPAQTNDRQMNDE